MSNVIDTVNMGYFIYDDVDTRDYDVQVYFKSVDSTPKRVGSFVSIPSRNGAFFVDEGRYEDMSHSYDIIALDPEEGKNIINAIARKTGHHRLEDSFNQDEFYQAIFVSAVEVRTETDRQSVKYALTFTRKPQRFLKSGETEITIPSQGGGYNLTNPTLFESKPLLMAEGYGDINIDDQVISIDNVVIGDVLLSNGVQLEDTTTGTLANMVTVGVVEFDQAKVNTGDTITLQPTAYTINIAYNNLLPSEHVEAEVTNQSGVGESTGGALSRTTASYTVNIPAVLFTVGTSASVQHSASWIYRSVSIYGGYSETTFPMVFNIAYDGANTITITAKHWHQAGATVQTVGATGDLAGYSTVLVDGTIYIDLDIGEAYWIKDGTVISANYTVHLGADLPTLKSGVNNITYTARITSLKIVPRWWKL